MSSPMRRFKHLTAQNFYPGVEKKAATLAYFLISNHFFVDGNKRIGPYVMLVFLELNDVLLEFTQQELIDLGLSVASGEAYDESMPAFIQAQKK